MTADHVAMNRLIRQAAGRGYPLPEPDVERIGNIGVGRGGAARPPDSDLNAAMNQTIRNAMAVKRGIITFTDLVN